jgi:hypothetical protein
MVYFLKIEFDEFLLASYMLFDLNFSQKEIPGFFMSSFVEAIRIYFSGLPKSVNYSQWSTVITMI